MKGFLKYHEPYDEDGYKFLGGWSIQTTKDWSIDMKTFKLSEDSLNWVLENNPPKFMEIEFDVIPTCHFNESTEISYHKFVAKIKMEHKPTGKVFLIDIDGTICDDIKNEDSHLYPNAKLYPKALQIINKWYEMGNVITFFTARESKDREVTETWLKNNGFKYHGLVMDKPRIKDNQEYVWIDNRKVRAITYLGTWSDLIEVDAKIQTFK